ncbi:hypothetical protein E2E30_08650 [Sphingomonas sp. AAP5]|jgi:hypothetical protein|uniref:Tetratricopeptide repeat protein n=1 Tax=Sphingomonas glacialis TaxID=658225 RepID=A0ABQ3LAC2_9SPHN|nr:MULTISPECIES: hypothetical protein [Sphingomonas]MDY7525272.1 hypothetical protein [Sphingomonas sp. 10B4]MEB0282779.1 hypothetical protein [Sphingomonas sp. 10B4]QBM75833.1 hypothetical protein E2E30_08650 [Sphingomonas sp. AAP5]GHH10056.1 hypothetical protein GCM10008023_07430 [Sphingomonas glacialis]
MKMVSKIALAATLVVGMNGAALVAPAFAAKKEKAADAAAPSLSKEARAAAVEVQTAMNATPKDLVKAAASLDALDAAAKSDYEKYLASGLRLALINAQTAGQPETQRVAALTPPLDAIIANPATPKTELGIRYNERAGFAFATKDYKLAAQDYMKARELGATDADLQLNIARSKVEAGDVAGGTADLEAAVKAEKAAGRKAPEAWYKYAFTRLTKAGLTEQADAWTAAWLTEYGTAPNWRGAIYTFGFQGPAAVKYSKNRIDLFRLLWATKSQAGQREYIDYADAALTIGLPNEAKTVIDEGLASGVIPKGNITATELQTRAKTGIAGSSSLAIKEKNAMGAPKGDLAQQAGDAYFGTRNYAKAIEMYRLCETKGAPDADRNNLHLGMALALSGDRAAAKTTLAKVAAEPNKAIARLWTVFVDAPPTAA